MEVLKETDIEHNEQSYPDTAVVRVSRLKEVLHGFIDNIHRKANGLDARSPEGRRACCLMVELELELRERFGVMFKEDK